VLYTTCFAQRLNLQHLIGLVLTPDFVMNRLGGPLIGKHLVGARRRFITAHQRALAHWRRPIPVAYWHALRHGLSFVRPTPNMLYPQLEDITSKGVDLAIPSLQRILRDDELGIWVLDAATIEAVWSLLQRDQPETILECGSGVSTIMFAEFLAEQQHAAPRRQRVISLEQDTEWVNHTRERLGALDLADYATVLHVPISSRGIYQIDCDALQTILRGYSADWLFIDGPSGPEGCRRWTLSQLWHLARPGARWLLDDALRDGELNFLRDWPDVAGIWPIGKGLATGFIR
jgi:predicted O-methyltransferase YrrM